MVLFASGELRLRLDGVISGSDPNAFIFANCATCGASCFCQVPEHICVKSRQDF